MTQLKICLKAIEELQRQCLHHNIHPIFLPYCLEEGPEQVFNRLKPIYDDCILQLHDKSFEEIKNIINEIPPAYRGMVEPIEEPLQKVHFSKIADYYIASKVLDGYYSISNALDSSLLNSHLLKVCPKLKNSFDDDGLLILNNKFELFNGGIKYGKYLLHYHQFLRRDFTSNLNSNFIKAFSDFKTKTNKVNNFRIALDHRRIMKFADYSDSFEADTWFGPKFDPEKLDDLSKTGLTVLLRSLPSPFELDNSLERTEILWKTNEAEKIKTSEIEEVSSIRNLHENWYINRYTHAQRDTVNHTFSHFDGAVKLYEKADYQKRIDQKMPNQIKSKHYIKLFRVDGKIDLESWLFLISMFYKGNEMIIEHFDPELFDKKFRPIITKYQDAMSKRN